MVNKKTVVLFNRTNLKGEKYMGKGRAVSGNYGALIKYLREQKGYSLKEMEEMTGVSAGYISRMETGERKAPSIPIVQLLADALDVELTELLDVSNDKTDEAKSISTLLLTNDFTIDGKLAVKKAKEILVGIIEKIVNASWKEETRFQDAFTFIELIDNFKKELAEQ